MFSGCHHRYNRHRAGNAVCRRDLLRVDSAGGGYPGGADQRREKLFEGERRGSYTDDMPELRIAQRPDSERNIGIQR